MAKFFGWLGISLMVMSCGKDIDLFIPRSNQGEIGNLDRLIDRLSSDLSGEVKYVVSVPCTGDRIFQVDKDVVITIPPDFVDLSEYPCESGQFDIHITVLDTKGEILVEGIPTLSEGKMLESRIELNLEIFQGSNKVRLAKHKQINIKVNDPDPRERMELFYGNDDNTEWIQADNDPNAWDNVENADWFIQDSFGIITGFGYECFSDSTDWINVDVFYDIPQELRTEVCIELPEEFTNKNTAVFMVFDDYNSVVQLHGNADLMQFCEPYGSSPIGYRVTFVVISEMGEDLYLFAKKSTTITAHHSEELSPVNTPYEEIRSYIHQL